MTEKPHVFVGSSAERLRVAHSLAHRLESVARVTVWDEDVFRLTHGTLETIAEKLQEFDFGVLILGADDTTTSRGRRCNAPRDNLLLECGLFIGALGRGRTFIVRESEVDLKLPSDLAGVTTAKYDGSRFPEDNVAAVRDAYLTISGTVERLGPRRPRPSQNHANTSSSYYGFADQEHSPEYRRSYRLVGYLAHFVERRLIEAGGKKQLVTPAAENRFLEAGINDAEGTWHLVWDRNGIYLNAVTRNGNRSLTSRYPMTPASDWAQHSSWDEAGRIADILLSQLADGVRLVSGDRS